MKKERNKDPMIFALSTDTLAIQKFSKNEDGEIINPDFNNKTYLKKAWKAHLKGNIYFKYKGQLYPVPMMQKSKLEKFINSYNEEE